MSKHIPILIPAYNPDERLTELVEALIREGLEHIIVVNDGSLPECGTIFNHLESLEPCTVLTHAVNCGKGRALKTGLNHIYLSYPGVPGIVTADCDGQHRPEDILKVAAALKENPGQLIMGARRLGRDIPFRSLFGNVCTRFVFRFVIGKKVSDTQSGLRGLPLEIVPELLNVKGERYEFEINMLILTKMKSIDILEVPIETIYIEDNISSHFNPFFDSMKIYFQLLRYAFSSMVTSFFDFLVFTLMFGITGSIMSSLLIARFVVGSMLNYIINRRLVFHSKTGVFYSLLKYYLALFIMSIISYLLINRAMEDLGFSVIAAKVVVETVLFAVTFLIQRDFVFQGKAEES
jgi:glycosyltransferase involved in cell wall biosynthesis